MSGEDSGTTYRCALPAGFPPATSDRVLRNAALAAAELARRLDRELQVLVRPAGAVDASGQSRPDPSHRCDPTTAGTPYPPGPAAGGASGPSAERLLVTLDAGAPPYGPDPTDHAADPRDDRLDSTDHAADSGDRGDHPDEPVAIRLDCRITVRQLRVTTRCRPTDPWWRGRAAAAEIFAEVFRALLADPHLTPAQAPGIGVDSRARVLRRYAGRAVDHGPFRPVSALIEEQADRDPGRPAVTFADRTLSYRELDERANGLAGALAAAGTRRGEMVPVFLADGLELPVAYLALMKLGAAFVPCDPAWPADRIRAALEVLRPARVLCLDPDPLPDPYRERAVRVELARIPSTPARPGVTCRPDEPVYGIFTSGSTGVPKCALNRHAGLTNRFRFMTRYFRATGDEVVLQNSKHTFDSSVWQLFWPLTTGGRVVVPAQGSFLDLTRTVDTIGANRITVTDFVPSIFNALVSMVDRDRAALARLATLRHLIVGGEEISPPMVHRLRALLPGLEVTNGYGPTEASIGMVFHPVTAADREVIPLGRPIDNCYAVVADARLRPLPLGATGEIVIGGACLGDGYLGSGGRTAEVFVPNPWPEIPGDRLYRTGDFGHFDADGRLHFAGRRDFQVKVNGVRIELGEIETAAERHPGVRQAKVLVTRQTTAGALALFASADAGVTEVALRRALRAALPRTSLPRYCFVLPELPLTDNGKVDRRQLRLMLERRLAEDADRLAGGAEPETLPDRVLRVFRLVLGEPDLTAETDFTEAGGDSIQALSVVVSLTAMSGVDLGVQDLFENPTAAAMARLLRSGPRHRTEPETVLMERDAVLPDELADPPRTPLSAAPRPPETILLTGATGFVGSRLLHQLLVGTQAQVWCCTRAVDDTDATARVVRALTDRGLWQPRFAERLHCVAADLARPNLGLSVRGWDRLARETDLILHNGALVNFLFDYRAHRPANVRGTAELLRLALRHRAKPFHHISTLGVLEAEAIRQANPLSEDYELSCGIAPASGYSRSKWVAERQLAQARRQGVTVTILRLGEVMPSADNGHPNQRALTHLLLSAFARLGICPAAAIRSDYTPVDYVAARVAATVTDPDAWGNTYHVFHPESVCFADVLSRVGTPITRLSCVEFLAALRAAAELPGERELRTLLSLLPTVAPADEPGLRRMFGGLLVDNPRLFRKDRCARLEQRWGLSDGWLHPSISAYRGWLPGGARVAPQRRPAPVAGQW